MTDIIDPSIFNQTPVEAEEEEEYVEAVYLEDLVEEFHTATEVPYYVDEPDAFARQRFWDLRMRLITEEYKEVMDALLDARNGIFDIEHIAKELADLGVVTIGTAQLLGIPYSGVFSSVMDSNMSKIPEDGVVLRRSDGKILKSPNYFEPDLSWLLDEEEDEDVASSGE